MMKKIFVHWIIRIMVILCSVPLLLLVDKGHKTESRTESVKTVAVTNIARAQSGTALQAFKTQKGADFIHVEQTKLITSTGDEFRIKGIAFGNNVWYNPKTAPITDHDEKSYKELSGLGFNCVRFYINYALFEDDKTPYQYKESGFKWLNKNIRWAKKYHIKLIINMHYPQGGIMSAGNMNFWQADNIKRFTSLWVAIAKRYANESVILGYDILNEPFTPLYQDSNEALNVYYSLINDTIGQIRNQDTRHVIFIERPYGCVDSNKKQVTYPWGDMGSFRTVVDTNVVYEYHFYDAFEYTAQKLSWIKTFRKWTYNDNTRIILTGKRDWKPALDLQPIYVKYDPQNMWATITSDKIQINNAGNAGYWYMIIRNYNKANAIYIDDVVVKEYDQNGYYLRDIYSYDFNNITYCDGWDIGTDGGSYAYDAKNGYFTSGCAKISGVGNLYKFNITYNDNNFFEVKSGNYYQVTARVRTSNDIVITPGVQMHQIEKLYYMNADYLEYKLNIFRDWSIANNVPIYLGEFAVTRYIMGNEYKGEQWVKDMFMILNKYDMNYDYHDYHEQNYGLYVEDGREKRQTANKILYQIFKSEVKKD